MKTRILTLALSMFIAAVARAELKWEQTQLELHPAANDKETVGHFKYQNTGDKPVRFKSVRTSCGCTVAQTQKEEVPPGEKGEITATLKIGDRTGVQIKNVTVETDDPANVVTVLTLKAVLPVLLEIKPTFVYWEGAEAPKPKTITVHAGKDFPVKELKVTSSSPDFQTKVEQVGNGEFKIDIEPKQMTHPAATTLTIQPNNSPRRFYAGARVTNVPAQNVPTQNVPVGVRPQNVPVSVPPQNVPANVPAKNVPTPSNS
jgi:hypothetical protein